MGIGEDRGRVIEDLGRLMDRLCAPDLTLAEAAVLRLQVHAMLASIQAGAAPGPAAPREAVPPPVRWPAFGLGAGVALAG